MMAGWSQFGLEDILVQHTLPIEPSPQPNVRLSCKPQIILKGKKIFRSNGTESQEGVWEPSIRSQGVREGERGRPV